MIINITVNFNLRVNSGIVTTLEAAEKMLGEVGLDVDGKLRLIAINYFNHSLIAIKEINHWAALITLRVYQ